MLLECGLARVLTTLAIALLKGNQTGEMLAQSFGLLFWATTAAGNDRWMVEMLKAGLLNAFVALTKVDSVPDSARIILRQSLPASMVHYSVVSQADVLIGGITNDADIKSVRDASQIFDEWRLFHNLTSDRMAAKSQYDSGEYVSAQACNNMTCGVILPRSRFRRCSGCARRYYCSPECQAVDWRADGHRTVCASFRTPYEPDPVTTRDRAFMRLLFHGCYERSKRALFLQQITFMHENPSTSKFYTMYDYTVTVAPPASGGRMEMHVFNVSQDGAHQFRIFPLRSSRPNICFGLRAIADAIPPGADLDSLSADLGEKVDALLHRTQDVVQIHCD
ncbi:hypothetical protein C8R44DRAFT_865966 [Mycena epipterygia]|nr:hypothetical protein C8R44DRAFT_865966 [Mycena epipterygia]